MKAEQVSTSIIQNYNKLSTMAKNHVKNPGSDYKSIWGLNYKHGTKDGGVGQLGLITRGKTEIDIYNGQIIKRKKPFFTTWKRALKNVNNMLQDMIEKFNDKTPDGKKVVQQTQVNILVFSKEAFEKIRKTQEKLSQRLVPNKK